MTATEAGLLLNVSPRTVQRLAASGDLPYVQKLPGPNGHYLFDPVAVTRYKAAQRVQRTTATT